MNSSAAPVRVVQWTTGKIAREAALAVLERPDLELVGVYAHSAAKVGKDVGELLALGREVGVRATDDIDELLALRPDVVLYMPLFPEVAHVERLLQAGINVATTAEFLTGRAFGEQDRDRLQRAGLEGGASLFGSGVNPGFAQYITAIASNICREVTYIKVTESYDIGMWAADANQDSLGWGRPAGDPGHREDVIKATGVFADSVDVLAGLLGATVDDVRCEVEFAHATQDVEVPGRDVKAGTVAGIRLRWIGTVGGQDAVETGIMWTVTSALDADWQVAMAYVVEVQGDPQVNLRVDVLPQDIQNFTLEDASRMGSRLTAMPVVNAVHAVVKAKPGIVTYADLPAVASRFADRS